jgi:DNA-binding MarR family transcriptional regulator
VSDIVASVPVTSSVTQEHTAEVAALAAGLEQLLAWIRRTVQYGEWSVVALSTLDALDRLGPHRITDLTARERITQPGMTGLVGRLEAAGLVDRRPDPSDGRATLVEITDDGRAYMRDLHRRRADVLADHVAQLPEDDRRALLRAAPALAALASRPLTSEGA